MARTLNASELRALDEMVERTSLSTVVSAIATGCSIRASNCTAYSTAQDTFETQANLLNNVVDKLPRKPKGY